MEQAHDFTDAVRDRDWNSEGHAYTLNSSKTRHFVSSMKLFSSGSPPLLTRAYILSAD